MTARAVDVRVRDRVSPPPARVVGSVAPTDVGDLVDTGFRGSRRGRPVDSALWAGAVVPGCPAGRVALVRLSGAVAPVRPSGRTPEVPGRARAVRSPSVGVIPRPPGGPRSRRARPVGCRVPGWRRRTAPGP